MTATAFAGPKFASWRTDRILLAATAIQAALGLAVFSHPAAPFNPIAFLLLAVSGLTTVGCWIGLLVSSMKDRRTLTVALVAAPVLAILAIGLVHTGTAAQVRFVLLDRPGFEKVVARAPARVVALPDRDLTPDESDESFVDFPGPCPGHIGSLSIGRCAAFAAGYLFYDEAGSGVTDDGGVAYLPAGAPRHDVGNGNFERPQFVHLTGPWYAFSSSW